MNIIVKSKVSEQVQHYLRDKIVQGKIAAGTRLVEVEIAASLGVSRTPVREALLQLRGMDLVRPLDKGGFEVGDVRRELVDILDIRVALEAHAARKAALVISEEQLREIADICKRMESLAFDQVEQRAALNRSFHEALIAAAGNARLSRIVAEYHDYFGVAQPLFDRPLLRKTEREHREILAALKDRNAIRASDAVTQHILGASRYLTEEMPKASEKPAASVRSTTKRPA